MNIDVTGALSDTAFDSIYANVRQLTNTNPSTTGTTQTPTIPSAPTGVATVTIPPTVSVASGRVADTTKVLDVPSTTNTAASGTYGQVGNGIDVLYPDTGSPAANPDILGRTAFEGEYQFVNGSVIVGDNGYSGLLRYDSDTTADGDFAVGTNSGFVYSDTSGDTAIGINQRTGNVKIEGTGRVGIYQNEGGAVNVGSNVETLVIGENKNYVNNTDGSQYKYERESTLYATRTRKADGTYTDWILTGNSYTKDVGVTASSNIYEDTLNMKISPQFGTKADEATTDTEYAYHYSSAYSYDYDSYGAAIREIHYRYINETRQDSVLFDHSADTIIASSANEAEYARNVKYDEYEQGYVYSGAKINAIDRNTGGIILVDYNLSYYYNFDPALDIDPTLAADVAAAVADNIRKYPEIDSKTITPAIVDDVLAEINNYLNTHPDLSITTIGTNSNAAIGTSSRSAPNGGVIDTNTKTVTVQNNSGIIYSRNNAADSIFEVGTTPANTGSNSGTIWVDAETVNVYGNNSGTINAKSETVYITGSNTGSVIVNSKADYPIDMPIPPDTTPSPHTSTLTELGINGHTSSAYYNDRLVTDSYTVIVGTNNISGAIVTTDNSTGSNFTIVTNSGRSPYGGINTAAEKVDIGTNNGNLKTTNPILDPITGLPNPSELIVGQNGTNGDIDTTALIVGIGANAGDVRTTNADSNSVFIVTTPTPPLPASNGINSGRIETAAKYVEVEKNEGTLKTTNGSIGSKLISEENTGTIETAAEDVDITTNNGTLKLTNSNAEAKITTTGANSVIESNANKLTISSELQGKVYISAGRELVLENGVAAGATIYLSTNTTFTISGENKGTIIFVDDVTVTDNNFNNSGNIELNQIDSVDINKNESPGYIKLINGSEATITENEAGATVEIGGGAIGGGIPSKAEITTNDGIIRNGGELTITNNTGIIENYGTVTSPIPNNTGIVRQHAYDFDTSQISFPTVTNGTLSPAVQESTLTFKANGETYTMKAVWREDFDENDLSNNVGGLCDCTVGVHGRNECTDLTLGVLRDAFVLEFLPNTINPTPLAGEEIVFDENPQLAVPGEGLNYELQGTLNPAVYGKLSGTSGYSLTYKVDARVTIEEEWKLGKGLTLQIGANAGQTMEIFIPKVTYTNEQSSTGCVFCDCGTLNSGSLLTRESATGTLGICDTAVDNVSRVRAQLGAQENRLMYTKNSVNVTHENTSRAESLIRDADMAKEAMDSAKGMVLAQSTTSMIAQANQAPQIILKLLQ
ncbi:hypothetical protein AGMMS49975_23760 [Clostridia bacterium]|nr:hypothetical protein AGMMS49975_23760 [Clostridia bacterium]